MQQRSKYIYIVQSYKSPLHDCIHIVIPYSFCDHAHLHNSVQVCDYGVINYIS